MSAGELRYRLTFAMRNDVTDVYGNTSNAWVDQFTVAANVTPRLGGEAVMASRLGGRQPVIIRVRQSADTLRVTTDWKARDQAGMLYNIRTTTDPDGGSKRRGFYIDMVAESGVAV